MMEEAGLAKVRTFAACSWDLGRTPAERLRLFWQFTKNARARLGLATHRPELIYRLPTRFGALSLRDNFGDVTNLPDLLHRSVYRVSRVASEGAIVDAGANIGLFALWMAHHNPGHRIYCFEPLAANARMVRLNCPTAVVSQFGLGRERRTATLRVDAHQAMASSVDTAWPTEPCEIEVRPLDEAAREHGIEQVAFLKIDTEGMEVDVLDGAAETLRRTQAVAMETHNPALHQASIERLRAAGLHIDAEERTSRVGLLFASRRSHQ